MREEVELKASVLFLSFIYICAILNLIGVINVFPEPSSNSSSPTVRPCHCNHNITKKEITLPFPPPPLPPPPPPPPPPSPGYLRRPDDRRPYDNIPKKKKETESSKSYPILNPGVFSDFGKHANDLLIKDYYNKNFFSLGTHSNAGVDLILTTLKNNTTTSSSTAHRFSIGDLTASYKSKNNAISLKIINEAVSSGGGNGFATKTQLHHVVHPSLNVFMYIEYPDWESSKLGGQITPTSYLNFTAATTLSEFPNLEGSATIGTPKFAIGGDVVCDTKMGEVKGRAGIRHTNSIFDVAALVYDGTLKVSCVHHLDVMKKNSVVAELKKCYRNDECAALTVGTLFEVNSPLKEDMKTVVKAKLDNHGNMGVVLQQHLMKDKMVKICSEFDTMDLNKTPKIGLSLVL